MLTRRGRLVLAAGVAAYAAAWAFGSKPLYPVAVGLLLAAALAWAWVRVLNKPMHLRRGSWASEHLEGDDVRVTLELTHEGTLEPGTLTLVERMPAVGEFVVTLKRGRRGLRGGYVIPRAPRGRYAVEATTAVLEDPFGLERVEVALETPASLLVYPRLVELEHLFSESGANAHDGRRLLLRRPSGFDFHSVREYERGESLRRVHWPSTARRGQLMVKELEDAPRDEIAVFLDATAGVVAGEPPESSFDVQVRAAGSILRAHAARRRRAVLVVNSLAADERRVRGDDGDWRRALELLATVRPDGRTPAAAFLADDGRTAARALELSVVTAQLPGALVERLVHRALGRRAVSVVYVDAASFRETAARRREPGLLRLQAAGVPVTVVRRGDDLKEKLSGAQVGAAASA